MVYYAVYETDLRAIAADCSRRVCGIYRLGPEAGRQRRGGIPQRAERGEIPADLKWLGKVVRDVSFGNAKRYFGLDV